MKALVIFQHKTGWKVAWMKPGFRHVLVAVEVYEGAVAVLDPSAGGLHLWAGGSPLDEIADHYDGTVVETTSSPGGNLWVPSFSCVDIVRRVLGVRGFIFTPYQLYRRLT